MIVLFEKPIVEYDHISIIFSTASQPIMDRPLKGADSATKLLLYITTTAVINGDTSRVYFPLQTSPGMSYKGGLLL